MDVREDVTCWVRFRERTEDPIPGPALLIYMVKFGRDDEGFLASIQNVSPPDAPGPFAFEGSLRGRTQEAAKAEVIAYLKAAHPGLRCDVAETFWAAG